jgi:hypothetical protein
VGSSPIVSTSYGLVRGIADRHRMRSGRRVGVSIARPSRGTPFARWIPLRDELVEATGNLDIAFVRGVLVAQRSAACADATFEVVGSRLRGGLTGTRTIPGQLGCRPTDLLVTCEGSSGNGTQPRCTPLFDGRSPPRERSAWCTINPPTWWQVSAGSRQSFDA